MIQKFLGTVSIIALAASLQSGAAAAADMDLPEGLYDWSGPYVGVKLGYATGTSNIHNPNNGSTTDNLDPSGMLVGLMSGYNFQFGSIVAGLDSDLSGAWITGNTNFNCPTTCRIEVDALSTTRARLGYAFDRVLPYVTGGIATAHANIRTGVNNASPAEFMYGWTAGAGLEWALADNVHWRVEYLFADLDKKSFNVAGGALRAPLHDVHIVRTGLSVKTQPLIDALLAAF